ncbi:MAG: hypothetical protein AMJ60_08365 [Desulfobacterales bacterium SG8_35]|nr:MAG: hypothetical protein AMJ60_08365 [Desulfobacterales bacterium SG8_35]
MGLAIDHAYDLSIAGLTFQVSCTALPICLEPAEHYRNFTTTGHLHAHKDAVTVQILLDEMPSLNGFTNIFNAGNTWSLLADEEKKFIVNRGAAADSSPLWLAHLNLLNRHVDVYCSSRFIKGQETGRKEIISPCSYPLDQILLMYFLGSNGFLIHAAGAIHQGKGYVFAGPSGAGKSTIALLLKKSEDFTLLSDDRIVISKSGDGFSISGTPWPGEAGIASNFRAPLHKIFFLEKGDRNEINAAGAHESLKKIMPVVSLPWYDEKMVSGYLDACGAVLEQTRAYILSFTPDPGSVEEIKKIVSD